MFFPIYNESIHVCTDNMTPSPSFVTSLDNRLKVQCPLSRTLFPVKDTVYFQGHCPLARMKYRLELYKSLNNYNVTLNY